MSEILLREISPISRVDQVRRAILEAIFAGALRPGERLLETSLAAQFGVSQATVNQALLDLDEQGVVQKASNRATTVAKFGLEEIEQLFAIRAVLECMAAEAAARHFRPGCTSRLEGAVERMRVAARRKELPSFYVADYDFHQELYRLSGNRFLYQACQAIAAAPFAYILCERAEPLPGDYASLATDHQEIVDSLALGPKKAVSVMRGKVGKWLGWQTAFLKPARTHSSRSANTSRG